MRRWFPEGWWSVAWLLVSVAIVSAPLWLPFAWNGDFGKWAEKAAKWASTRETANTGKSRFKTPAFDRRLNVVRAPLRQADARALVIADCLLPAAP